MSAREAHHDLYGWELDALLDAIHSQQPASQPSAAPAPAGGDPFAAPPSSLSEL